MACRQECQPDGAVHACGDGFRGSWLRGPECPPFLLLGVEVVADEADVDGAGGDLAFVTGVEGESETEKNEAQFQ